MVGELSGVGGFKGDGYWNCSAYPTNTADETGFEASVKVSLRDMIRINRNHPSIIVWSMCNEPFFSAKQVMPKVQQFLTNLAAYSHELDPTRPAWGSGAANGGTLTSSATLRAIMVMVRDYI